MQKSQLKFKVSGFTFQGSRFRFLSVLCLLSAALCLPAWAGGSWLVDGQAVQTLDVQTSNADPSALYTDGSRTMQAPLVFDPSVSSSVTGLFKANVPWDSQYDFFTFNSSHETVVLSPNALVGFEAGGLILSGNMLKQTSEGTIVDFAEHRLAGGWWLQDVLDDPYALIHRQYADNRYVQQSGVTSPLIFDSSLSSETTGLFKATVPWDAEYEFFTFNPSRETVVLSPTVSSLGFEAGNVILHSSGTIRYKGNTSTYISLGEHFLAGGGWFIDSVENDSDSILNRGYADNRYVMQSTGITTNHTVQAGDVLHIQNGVITAINP
jgi:hypothetical protein